MATLTPGVLSKLLQHANTDVKVAGEHRSPLLQVIGIVPNGEDDPLKSRGFFLKVSDSLHSTYVSISDDDADLIFSDKIQLGQFVHVAGLDTGSPVPVLRGVKPLPRRRPCVGNPRDLGLSDRVVEKGRETGCSVKKSDSKRLVEEENVKKSRRASTGNFRVDGLDLKVLTPDSLRRNWVKSPSNSTKDLSNSSDSASDHSDKKVSLRSDSSLRHKKLSISPLKINSNHLSLRTTSKASKGDTNSSNEASIPYHLFKVHLSHKTWADDSILWGTLPSSLHDIGKDAVRYRNAAFSTTVNAMQEASAAESVVRSLSMFAELCASAKQSSPQLLVEQFLNLHKIIHRAATVTEALLKTRHPETKTGMATSSNLTPLEAHKIFTDKKSIATSWIQAALETDLSTFSLLCKQEKTGILQPEQHFHIVVETSPESPKFNYKNQSSQNKQILKKKAGLSDLSAKGPSPSKRVGNFARKKTDGGKGEWSRGQGLKEMASLAKQLVSVSRRWFLNYLENALKEGFGGREGEGESEIVGILGQLKRVNQWLEDAIGEKDQVDETVESLKKKLYSFLLEHVDSFVVS